MAEKPSKIDFKIKLSTETLEKIRLEESQSASKNVTESSLGVDVAKQDSPIMEDILQEENVHSESEIVSDELETSDSDNEKDEAHEVDCETIATQVNEKDLVTNGGISKYIDIYAAHTHYEGDVAIYTDPVTKQEYTWSTSQKEWILKVKETEVNQNESQNIESGDEQNVDNDAHTYTDQDGSVFMWDKDKKAWFPKLDDEFLANYQMAYGFIDNITENKDDSSDDSTKEKAADEQGVKKKNPPEAPKWFDISEDQNTNVYVSNLPLDITEEEFVDLMQKCGLIMRDPTTQKMKVKLYTRPNSKQLKGDALCTYIKIESVELALDILDGCMVRNHRIQVEKATFQMKGEYDPTLKPKKQKKDKDKLKKMQEKLFDWRPEKFRGERSKHEKVVIIKNVFDPSVFDTEVQLILEYQQDLREECSKCGEVRKVVLFDRHPEGVAQVTMKEPEEADSVVKLINGRWFGKRQLTAEIWDGKSRYKTEETDADLSKRLGKWENFLEEPGVKKRKETTEEEKKTTDEGESEEKETEMAVSKIESPEPSIDSKPE